MDFRSRILKGMAKRRQVPSTLGLRTSQLFVIVRRWEGGRRSAEGGYVDTAVYDGQVIQSGQGAGLEVIPRPLVRFIRTREIFESGGLYNEGDLRVNYIQPRYTSPGGAPVGYSATDIAPEFDHDGIEVIYRFVGGVNGEYARIGSVLERWGHYELTLSARRTTPGKL